MSLHMIYLSRNYVWEKKSYFLAAELFQLLTGCRTAIPWWPPRLYGHPPIRVLAPSTRPLETHKCLMIALCSMKRKMSWAATASFAMLSPHRDANPGVSILSRARKGLLPTKLHVTLTLRLTLTLQHLQFPQLSWWALWAGPYYHTDKNSRDPTWTVKWLAETRKD